MTARHGLLDGLARDADIFEVLSGLAPLHPRNETFPGEPDLLEEAAYWQTDDFWQYAIYAAVAHIRAAASRAGISVRQACQDLDKRPGHPAL